MSSEQLSDLFKYQQNRLLKRIYSLAIFFLIAGLFSGIINLVATTRSIIVYNYHLPDSFPYQMKLHYLLTIIFLFVEGIIFFFQAFYFYQFVKNVNNEDLEDDTDQILSSLNNLIRYIYLGITFFVINILWGVINFIIG